MKRNEILEKIDILIGSSVPGEEVGQRIKEVRALNAIVGAQDTVKLLFQGLPEPEAEVQTKKCYFKVVFEQLMQLIETLPEAAEKNAVGAVFQEAIKVFRDYKNYEGFNADIKKFCLVVLKEYTKQRMNQIPDRKEEIANV